MTQKKNNPQKNTSHPEEKSVPPTTEKNKTTPPKTSPRKTVNLFMVVILLIIVGGIYLYQKGYITKYYPFVKTTFTDQSPLDATVDIPQDDPENFSETLGNYNAGTPASSSDKGEKQNDPIPPTSQEAPSPTSDAYGSSLPIATKPDPSVPESEALKNLQERMKALEEKLSELSPLAETEKRENTGVSPGNKRLLYALSNLQDLQGRFYQGLPFVKELSTLKDILSTEDYAILEEYAPVGVPNLSYLIKNFKEVERLLKQREAFKNSKTFLERSQAFLGQLVHIEKMSPETQGLDNETDIKPYRARLRKGDVESVIKEIDDLQNKDDIVTSWLSHAKAYDSSHKIISKTKQALFQHNL